MSAHKEKEERKSEIWIELCFPNVNNKMRLHDIWSFRKSDQTEKAVVSVHIQAVPAEPSLPACTKLACE